MHKSINLQFLPFLQSAGFLLIYIEFHEGCDTGPKTVRSTSSSEDGWLSSILSSFLSHLRRSNAATSTDISGFSRTHQRLLISLKIRNITKRMTCYDFELAKVVSEATSRKYLTAAYATATLVKFTGVFHQVALEKQNTSMHPIRPIQAIQG
jgi:hypothetical protein